MGVKFSIKEVMGDDEVELRVMGISLKDIIKAKKESILYHGI